MKKLAAKHIFTMARIINKAKLKDKLSDVIIKAQAKKVKVEDIGVQTVFTIIEACGENGVDKEIYEFLEDVCEVKNIENMEIEKFFDIIKELSKENNLLDFFKKAGLLK